LENLNINNSEVDNSNIVLIVENVGEDLAVKSNAPNNTVLEGVCAVFGAKNNNNRVYEKDEYLPHLGYLNEKIAKRSLVGDLDHPPHFDVSLKSASHIIEALTYDGGNQVKIKLRILEDTPNGKIAKALLNGGVNLSISSRAAGQVLNEGKVKLHKIFTYDLVGEPGFTEAILKKTVNESLKGDFKMLTESYDHLKEDSYVEKNHLSDISESLNFSDNFKIYKINKSIENVLESSSTQSEKNNNTMAKEFATVESMNNYSQIVKKEINDLKSELQSQKAVFESNGSVDGSDIEPVKHFVNYLAENFEGLMKYTEYLAEMVNKSVNYTEHVAETTNNSIGYATYLGEKLTSVVSHQDHIVEKLDQNINYSEYLKENVNKAIKYQNYLAVQLDESIQYSEYVGKGANEGIEFAEYLSNSINENRMYAQYVAEKAGQSIEYGEHIAEQLNSGSVKGSTRNLLGNVEKLDESASIDALLENVKAVIVDVTTDSAKQVLESKYPFLKTLDDTQKDAFYALDSSTKQSIVETLGGAIWFNQADVIGIMESVISTENQNVPNHIKFMPTEYKATWDKMNENEKNRIHAKSQLHNFTSPYQVKSFWDDQDLRGVNERIEIEQSNIKMNKTLNESQSTEGMISIERVVEHNRGYASNYLDTLARQASYRK
jgi:hypothetical protein